MHGIAPQSPLGPALSDWTSAPDSSSPEAIRGGAVVAASMIARQILTLSITILLARLLTPAEFGAVAVIMALVALGLVLQQAGLSGATVQRERVSVEAVSTMFWINAAFGLALTVLFIGLAHPIAELLEHPELALLCQVTAATFLLNGLAVQHRALLQRSMRFGATARVDISSGLCGGLCAIVVAGAGYGYWALVAQVLVTDALALLMLVRATRWPLTRPVLTGEVREMVAFGCSMLGFNVLVTAANNLHVVLLGRGAGIAAAGIYTRAYALASVPQNLLQGAAAHVALAKLARTQQDSDAFVGFYYRSVQLLTLVALPVALTFAVFGDQVALVVYGSQWDGVSGLLRIFSIGLAVAPLLHSTGPVLLARGEPNRMFRWGVFGASVIMLGTLIGLRWGITGVAWGWSATTLLLLLPCLAYCYRGTGLTVRGLAAAVGSLYGAAACALPAAWAARLVAAPLPAWAALPLGLLTTVLAYAALCYFVFGQQALIKQVIQRLLRVPGRTAS